MCTNYCIVENKVPKHKTRMKIAEHYERTEKKSSAHEREQAHKRSSSRNKDEANAKGLINSKRKNCPAKPRNPRTRALENRKNLGAPRVVNQGCQHGHISSFIHVVDSSEAIDYYKQRYRNQKNTPTLPHLCGVCKGPIVEEIHLNNGQCVDSSGSIVTSKSPLTMCDNDLC